jgi:AraC-like DNA-binding protein
MQTVTNGSHGLPARAVLPANDRPDPRSRIATDYLEKHIKEEVYVADVAVSVNLSTSWFAHQFSRRMGRGPYKMLMELRVERAKDSLANTDLLVKEIAGQLGFLCVETFIRNFRALVGVTPREWRKNCRPKEAGGNVIQQKVSIESACPKLASGT